jgi:putative drug exporter of the RND superfamily
LGRLADGACQLKTELTKGAARLKGVLLLEHITRISLIGRSGVANNPGSGAAAAVALAPPRSSTSHGHHQAGDAPAAEKPQEALLRNLTQAEEAVSLIAGGANRAGKELNTILTDPVGRRALDHLLITSETVHDHPELSQSFAAYITPDGHRARIDLTQTGRMFSHDAMDQTESLRRQLNDYLGEYDGIKVLAKIGGANAESADVRAMTHSDQVQSWIVVPIGVFLVLILTLRDPLACFNLVATMVLTYAFALGATHLLFVTLGGAQGLDWKVPYFLFVLLVAVGVDYNVFLMTRLQEESHLRGLREGIIRAIGQTGGLISSAALITACSFASFLFSPLASLRQLGFALVVGILVDAILVRPLLVPCGHWLLRRTRASLAAQPAIRRPHLEFDGVASVTEAATLSTGCSNPNGTGCRADCQSAPPILTSLSRGSGASDRTRPERNDRQLSSSPTQILPRSRVDTHDLALIQMLGHLDGAAG